MDISIKEIAEKLMEYDEYRIVYHIRPDGDCIGSAFALALALQSVGKKCDVAGQDEIPRGHRYMTDKVKLDKLENPVYIAVDSATDYRVGTFANNHFTFCIDHHKNTFTSADFRYVEQDCGACSEIIFKLIKAMNVNITKQIADFLYTALVTDTMCFRTLDTSVQSFETAAELTKLGADIYRIGRRNAFIKSEGRRKIERILYDSLHFTCDNKIVTGIITLNDLKSAGILDSDLENINSMVEEIEGIYIGVTIRELPNGKMRCSVRTNNSDILANKICGVYGGGGHDHAACCEIDASPFEAREIIEKTCKEFLMKSE